MYIDIYDLDNNIILMKYKYSNNSNDLSLYIIVYITIIFYVVAYIIIHVLMCVYFKNSCAYNITIRTHPKFR